MSSKMHTIEQFNGKDYTIWSVHMKNILQEHNLIKYIEGNADISNYSKREDLQALGEVQFMLNKTQMHMVMKCTRAYDAWCILKNKHQQSSKSNLVFLKNQFYSLQMNEKESIQEFTTCINETTDQLEAFSENKEGNEEDKALILLRGLLEMYKIVSIAICKSGKAEEYNHVVNSLTNEEM